MTHIGRNKSVPTSRKEKSFNFLSFKKPKESQKTNDVLNPDGHLNDPPGSPVENSTKHQHLIKSTNNDHDIDYYQTNTLPQNHSIDVNSKVYKKLSNHGYHSLPSRHLKPSSPDNIRFLIVTDPSIKSKILSYNNCESSSTNFPIKPVAGISLNRTNSMDSLDSMHQPNIAAALDNIAERMGMMPNSNLHRRSSSSNNLRQMRPSNSKPRREQFQYNSLQMPNKTDINYSESEDNSISIIPEPIYDRREDPISYLMKTQSFSCRIGQNNQLKEARHNRVQSQINHHYTSLNSSITTPTTITTTNNSDIINTNSCSGNMRTDVVEKEVVNFRFSNSPSVREMSQQSGVQSSPVTPMDKKPPNGQNKLSVKSKSSFKRFFGRISPILIRRTKSSSPTKVTRPKVDTIAWANSDVPHNKTINSNISAKTNSDSIDALGEFKEEKLSLSSQRLIGSISRDRIDNPAEKFKSLTKSRTESRKTSETVIESDIIPTIMSNNNQMPSTTTEAVPQHKPPLQNSRYVNLSLSVFGYGPNYPNYKYPSSPSSHEQDNFNNVSHPDEISENKEDFTNFTINKSNDLGI